MSVGATAAVEYDRENIFAKILDKKAPCFKVYESDFVLAFLDKFPQSEGHTIVIPKVKNATDLLSMKPAQAAKFLGEVQKVAKAVKQVFDVNAVNIVQNCGAAAGQTVFHPHVHIIPRKENDDVLKFGAGKELSDTDGKTRAEKLSDVLNPKKPLKKATYAKAGSIRPETASKNYKLKVLEDLQVVESKAGKFWEAKCGDTTGTVVVSLREHQKDAVKKGGVVILRNAATKMVRSGDQKTGHIRLAVDKWGKVDACEEEFEGTVEMKEEKNVSHTEYELVPSGAKSS